MIIFLNSRRSKLTKTYDQNTGRLKNVFFFVIDLAKYTYGTRNKSKLETFDSNGGHRRKLFL